MGETVQNITLNTSGGPEAAAAIDGAAQAMGRVVQAHNSLEGAFQHKFQHIGLMMFAGEALRSAGLGQETRQIINLLNLSITTLGASLGAAVGPIMLIGAAFAALYGAMEKVHEKHRDHLADLEKLNTSSDEELKKLNESIGLYEKYVKNVSGASKEVRAVLEAKKELAQFESAIEIKNLELQIEETKRMIETKLEERRALLQTAEAEQNLTTMRVLATVATKGFTEAVREVLLAHHDFKKEIDDTTQSALELNVKWKEAAQRLKDLQHGVLDTKKAMEELIKANEDAAKKVSEAWKKSGNDQEENFKKHQEEMKTRAKKMADDIGQPVGQAFAKMIVEGKSFADEMKQAFKLMAEKIIEDIIRIEVEWAVLSAMGLPTGGGFGAMFGGGFAAGGTAIVDKPTMFLAGEGGSPEVVTFSPVGSGGPSGVGGSQVTISMENHFHGITNPDDIADTVGSKILDRIRGRGDIGFSRSS